MNNILHDTGTHCFYCEKEFNPLQYGTNQQRAKTRDHVIPLSKNGVNLVRNMVYACSLCNRRKASLSLEEFSGICNNNIAVKNIKLLIDYRDKKGDALYKKKPYKVGEIKPVYPTVRQINKSAKAQPLKNKVSQSDEKIFYLQRQTVEQFRERKRVNEVVNRLLREPQQNFHYA